MRFGFYPRILRTMLAAYHAALWLAGHIGRRPRAWRDGDGCEILLTGRFHCDNWVNAHLRPLAASAHCARLYVVTNYPVQPVPKLTVVRPPRWLRCVAGDAGSRLLTFAGVAFRRRPQVVGGFHLLFNGMIAALVARLVGAKSMYFCVGGPAEVVGGGIASENRLFGRLAAPDPAVERQLVRIVAAFDLIITMGSRAVRFFQDHGVHSAFRVVSGGMDTARFAPPDKGSAAWIDAILVGRLADVKRVDVFLRAVRAAETRLPQMRAMIVGDGERRAELEALARELAIEGRVVFAGRRDDVPALLQQARLFVLTSDTEGLSLALMEAMTSGLPAVVSDVGDLADLVQHGHSGLLVAPRDVDGFAEAMATLLKDEPRRVEFGRAAQAAARRYESKAVTAQWDEILGNGVLR